MISFKTVAETLRKQDRFFCDDDRYFFPLAILEIAHALSRGKKPSSCSYVTGDLRNWLRRMYTEKHPYCHDHMGNRCSIADDVLDSIYGWAYMDSYSLRLAEAIKLCRALIKPSKKGKDIRGDLQYQFRHKETNLKRKERYWQDRQGSHYDDSYYAGGMDDLDLLIDSHSVHDDEDPMHEPLDERDLPTLEQIIGQPKQVVRRIR